MCKSLEPRLEISHLEGLVVAASFDSSPFWLCLCQLSLLCFGLVSYVLRQDIAFIAKKQFVFFACIFGRRSNGLKFRSGLSVAAILRCGSA